MRKDNEFRIGIVGYSSGKFDKDVATARVISGIVRAQVRGFARNQKIVIVSGLTNLGIPALAYEYAKLKEYKTVGIACSKATEYDCFPVDEKIIVGDNWGDESNTFLEYCDFMVRVGGGKQSLEEIAQWNKKNPNKSIEYELSRDDQSE